MKRFNPKLLYILIIVPSIVIYLLHYLAFKDSEYIIKDFVAQLAFIPVFYFFSTIIIDNILARREKAEMIKKINMLIGVFFSEIGNTLIKKAPDYDINYNSFSKKLRVTADWNDKEYAVAKEFVNSYNYKVHASNACLYDLKGFLLLKRNFLISMLENQNLLEHDTFTDLILAVFHLCEELDSRQDFNNQPVNDSNHLSVDIVRAYRLLVFEWLNYMQHVQAEYPHLFSLAVRTNPFIKENNVTLK